VPVPAGDETNCQEAQMKIKSMGVLAIGAAIGYALNTPAGREKLHQLKQSAERMLGNPQVQGRTADLADKARQKTTGLPDPVQKVANSTIDAAQKKATEYGSSSTRPDEDTDAN
jgi:hypothetical protein